MKPDEIADLSVGDVIIMRSEEEPSYKAAADKAGVSLSWETDQSGHRRARVEGQAQ